MLYAEKAAYNLAMKEDFNFTYSDGSAAYASSYPHPQPKAVLQLLHGMAEHRGRYRAFAELLQERGYAVYIDDRRGHGEHISRDGARAGYFGVTRERIDQDVLEFNRLIQDEVGQKPVMMGHSMGSLLLRSLSEHQNFASALIFMGTAHEPLAKLGAAKFLASILRQNQPSQLLDKLSFGSFNRPFQGEDTTGFAWLSSDPAEVQLYVDDPLCGFVSCPNLFASLFYWTAEARRQLQALGALDSLFISGSEDPVGGAKALTAIERVLQGRGLANYQVLLLSGARHEVLHEPTWRETTEQIIAWLDQRFAA